MLETEPFGSPPWKVTLAQQFSCGGLEDIVRS
jgi:hypothetical protein